MAIEHSEAVVIRSIEFSESSLILELFTRDFGRISGLAKGARRLKNPYDTALDLLARISVSFIRKNSDALDLLTEAKLITRFQPARSGMSGFYAGCYLAELLQMVTEDGDTMPELYDLTVETLSHFGEGTGVEEHLYQFQWGLMEILGERPSTSECVSCGRSIDLQEKIRRRRDVGFAPLDGGTVCAECGRKQTFRQWIPADPRAVVWLDELGLEFLPDFPDSNDPRVRADIRSITDSMIDAKCGRRPRTREAVYRILREESRPKTE